MKTEQICRRKLGVALYLSATAAIIMYSVNSVGNHGFAWPLLALMLLALLLFAAVPLSPLFGFTGYLLLAHGLPRYSELQDLLLANRILEWLCALLALGMLLWTRESQVKPDFARPSIGLMLLFIAWIGISLMGMLLQGTPWHPYLRHHPLLFFQALVLFLISSQYLIVAQRSYALALVICLIPALRWLLQPQSAFYLEGDVALLSATALALALVGSVHAPGRMLRVAFALTAVNAAAMLLVTQNRAAAMAAAAALVVLWLSARRKALVFGIALLVGVIVIAIANPHDYWNRFRAIWSPAASHATAELDRKTVQERLKLWRAGYDMASDNPWLGVGPGNYPNAVVYYDPDLAGLPAHNSIAAIAAETGIPGLILFLALILSIFSILARQIGVAGSSGHQVARMLLAAIMGLLAGGLFISRHDSPLLYLMLGWAVAITRPAIVRNWPGAHQTSDHV
jgi:O-antigen ligase